MIATAEIVPGLVIPSFSREGTLQHWSRYAAVNYEYAGHHIDDAAARHEGFPAPIAMGSLLHGYIHAMLRTWVGPDRGRVASVGIRLKAPFILGRSMTARGTVTGVLSSAGFTVVALDVRAEDDTGTCLIEGTAQVHVWP